MEKSKKAVSLPSRTVQKKKNISVLFVEIHIQIRCKLKSGFDAPKVRVDLMKNSPIQMLLMFVFIGDYV